MPTDPEPVDFAALKEILSAWNIVGLIMLLPMFIGLFIAYTGAEEHRADLMVLGLSIAFMATAISLIVSWLLIFRMNNWLVRHTESAPKAPAAGDPVDASA